MAAELRLLTKSWGKYTIDLYCDDADGGGIEKDLAREGPPARALHELLCAQYPGARFCCGKAPRCCAVALRRKGSAAWRGARLFQFRG